MNITKRPSFFLVGAPKAGTTSVFQYLHEHPDVYIPSQKELNYFSANPIRTQKLYYENAVIIEHESDYLAHYAAASDTQTLGDASVSYLFYDEVPQLIKAFNGQAKIIILLREPVARAISHYRMDHNLGYIKETFDELFLAKLRGGWSLAIQQVFDLSLYCAQIERYLNIFPRERVHIILQEELSKDAEKMARQIYSFLNVDNTFFPNISIKHNTYRTPSNSLVRKLYQNKRTRKTVEALLPNVMKKRLGKRIMKQGTSQPINQVLVRQARKYYASDVAKLSEVIGIDLGKTWGY